MYNKIWILTFARKTEVLVLLAPVLEIQQPSTKNKNKWCITLRVSTILVTVLNQFIYNEISFLTFLGLEYIPGLLMEEGRCRGCSERSRKGIQKSGVEVEVLGLLQDW